MPERPAVDEVVAILTAMTTEERTRLFEALEGLQEIKDTGFCVMRTATVNLAMKSHRRLTLEIKSWMRSYKDLLSKFLKRFPRGMRKRDKEVIRLKKENSQRTAGQIAQIIRDNPAWKTTRRGKPLNASAVRSILRRFYLDT